MCVFQLSEPKTKKYIRDMKPTNINDLSDLNSLIRPGTDSEGYFKNRSAKKLTYAFNVKEWIDVLQPTHSIIVYQEQIIYLFNKLANFSLGDGDMARRSIEKNKTEEIAKWKEKFIQQCKYPELAEYMFNEIVSCAGYSFNKSHSCLFKETEILY
jgi:DNA polymerase-3 subunit alpha